MVAEAPDGQISWLRKWVQARAWLIAGTVGTFGSAARERWRGKLTSGASFNSAQISGMTTTSFVEVLITKAASALA